MNAPIDTSVGHKTHQLADVQGSQDNRQIYIDRVGIRGIRHPVRVLDRSAGEQSTIAMFDMYVDLPKELKGTHMSRFIEVLNAHDDPLTVQSFPGMLNEMASLLEAKSGCIEVKFPYFVRKAAPVSRVESLMDYEVTLLGRVDDGKARISTRVVVPVTSLCPCSKQISDYGAHNQRSHVTVTIHSQELVWIEELIDLVEQEASCQLWGLLKRPDEKFVTEYAYDNPKFVEDMVRDVAARFNADPRIQGYVVESENFESIHNHSAYACIEKAAPA